VHTPRPNNLDDHFQAFYVDTLSTSVKILNMHVLSLILIYERFRNAARLRYALTRA